MAALGAGGVAQSGVRRDPARHFGCESCRWPADGRRVGGDPALADPVARAQAVADDRTARWVDHVLDLLCRGVSPAAARCTGLAGAAPDGACGRVGVDDLGWVQSVPGNACLNRYGLLHSNR
ncbi:hypothetical protein SDC9_172232 [bioreactor metagenome]|uniref:Uncharacterized protein n=1 Tax=bioreactor metagenome TaxID=1076179 RepID=A0A645GD45_9ZZZZ